jgi:hypothetical protein
MSSEQMVAEPGKDGLSTWDGLRQLADELELEIHLAGMDTRQRWHALKPRLAAFERRIKNAGGRASRAVTEELEAIWDAMRGLRDEVANRD